MNIKIIKGKNLDKKFIKDWNKIMRNAFNEDRPLTFKNKKIFANDTFFIISEYNNLLSVGRLRPVEIEMGKTYNILGIADVVSIIKNKGYGKLLMSAVLKYLKKQKKTGIGFCLRENSKFYEKSGFNIVKDLAKLFIYQSKEGLIVNDWDNDVIYSDGKDLFMKHFLLTPRKVFTSIPHW